MGLYQQGGKHGHGRRVSGLGLTGRLVTQWSRWLGARYHQARGRLVVFDRYAYDALLPPRRPTSRRGRVRRWLLGHACPHPDLVVVLDAPGEVLYERKGELSPAVLEAERVRYLELRRRLPEMVVIDATQEPNQVRRELVSLIWQRYQRRWGRAQGAS
jgi:thymidylate kinase